MSGTDGALRLIELTSAQLCHDFSGIVGSLGRALASPANGDQVDSTIKVMASEAAQMLTARLELRQAAWGPDSDLVTSARIQRLAQGLPEQVNLDASALQQNSVFSAATGRVVLNLLLLAADSLPSGGTIVLAGEPDDLFIRISGPAAAWPIGMAVCLADETEAQSALTDGRSLQMALTALLARAGGTRLSVMLSPTVRHEPPILRLGG